MKKIFFMFLVALFFFSCTPRIAIKVDKANDVVAEVDIKPTLATKKLIKSFSGLAEGSSFKGEEASIQNEKTEDGMEIIKFRKTASLEVDAVFKFPASYNLDSNVFELKVAEKKLICSLNREKLKAFFSNISPQDKEYIELLMAPALQNEKMSEDEYIKLISSAYGLTIANELKSSSLLLEFQLPDKIKNISITPKNEYTLNGNVATLSIPLTSILVLDSPLNIVVQY